MYCNGVDKMVVHGMKIRVLPPQKMVTSKYCNGVEQMVVPGIEDIVLKTQQDTITYIFWNGWNQTCAVDKVNIL